MNNRMKNKNFWFALAGVLFGFAAMAAMAMGIAPAAWAQVDVDPNFGATFGLGTADLMSTVIRVVQWALGFLGLIAVIFIMYGGFIWMTAAGNTDKVDKAKKIITRAVVGLLIVMFAWAIVTFIIDRALELTNPSASSCTIGDANGCYLCIDNGSGDGTWQYQNAWPGCDVSGGNSFRVTNTDPADGEINVYMCSIVQAEFSGTVDPAHVNGAAFLYVDGGAPAGTGCGNDAECASGICAGVCQGNWVPGTWQASGDVLEFLPNQEHLPNTTYMAYLCGTAPGPNCTDAITELPTPPAAARPFAGHVWFFTTGTSTLNEPPTVTGIYPQDNATDICLNTPIAVTFSQKMRKASMNTSTVTYTDLTAGVAAALKTPFGVPSTWDAFSTRPAVTMTAGNEYSMTLTAGTPGNNDPTNGLMDVCLNHLDGDYNTNEDGSPGDDFMTIANQPNGGEVVPWNFFADTDTTNTQCVPEITSISPVSRRYDEPEVTISGSNLSITGDIIFNSEVMHDSRCVDGTGNPNLNCLISWSPTGDEITTRIPAGPAAFASATPSAGAADGNVRVDIGPNPEDVSNNQIFDVSSPQISKASGRSGQAHGGIGQAVTLLKRPGGNNGFTAGGTVDFINLSSHARVSADYPNCTTTWEDDEVLIKVPDNLGSIGITACDTSIHHWYECPTAVPNSVVGIQVHGTGGAWPSNIIKFIYTTETPGPTLCEAVPNCGVQNATVNLTGEAFGTAAGQVYFNDPPTLGTVLPPWTEGLVTARVPNLANGSYTVNVQDAGGVGSNEKGFSVPCGDIPRVVENPSCAATCVGGPTPGSLCNNDDQCGLGGVCQISMASPNPYKGATDVCVNAAFGARFNMLMNPATISTLNILLDSCGSDPTCAAPVAEPHNMWTGAPVDWFVTRRVAAGVPIDLEPDTYYRVTIRRQVESAAGARMNADYVWMVKTKADTGPCPVEDVMVMPGNAVIYNIGDTEAYSALAIGPNCALLDSSDYTWSWTSDSAIIASVTGSTTPNETATGNALGTTYINASAEGESGRGRLKVDPASCAFNPTRCADPDQDGVNECTGSRCDIYADRCVPVIADYNEDGQMISPQTGIGGSFVTIEGCYFGNTLGTVYFGGNAGVYECVNAWSDHSITVSEPGNPAPNRYLIDVHRPDGRCLGGTNDGTICTASASCTGGGVCTRFTTSDNSTYGANQTDINTYYFDVSNMCSGICVGGANANQACEDNADCASGNCSGGVPPPSGVAPGICPPLDPASGREGTTVLITGQNFSPATLNPATTRVYYHAGRDDTWDEVVTDRSQAWTNTSISRSQVPDGAVTGGVSIQVNNCPSNSQTFSISCSRNSQCSTGCCQGNICVAAGNCSTGAVGTLCQLPANATNNGTCAVGPLSSGGDYRCIDPAGHRDPNVPLGAGYPPAGEEDCRTCCYPGQVSSTGLTCSTNIRACSGTTRGMYCGCTADAQCTGGTGCGTDTCCTARPAISGWLPATSPLQCRNAAFTVNFSEQMLGSSFVIGSDVTAPGADESVFLVDTTANVTVPARVRKQVSSITVYSTEMLANGHSYEVRLRTELIQSDNGVAMTAAPGWASHAWTIAPAADVCRIDDIEVNFIDYRPGINEYPPLKPTFICSFAGCFPGDFGLPGANLYLFAYPLDQFDNILNGGTSPIQITWTETDPAEVFTPTHTTPVPTPGCPSPADDLLDCFLTSDNHDGTGYFNITADGTSTTFGDLGTFTKSVPVLGTLCTAPWPDPSIDPHPYVDAVTNFSTWYCREDGLPALKSVADIVIKDGAPSVPGEDELIREFFFLRDGTDDAIGIRVMENENRLSPFGWYRRQFGPAAPEPQSLTVDGYPAVRAGRTVYVAATNLVGGVLYANIYLMSYNEEASGETIEIYNRLLKNWSFNTNISGENKGRIQRDIKRLADLSDIAGSLIDYKGAQKEYPRLAGGTFVANVSTSLWPSWQETLGAALNRSMPTDPINEFLSCSGDYDANTCWDDTNKRYICYAGSRSYQYLVTPSGDAASLFTNLEYLGPGSWVNYAGDPYAAIPNASSNCLNYEYGITGTATDRQGPIINSVDSLVAGVNLISGTRAMTVDVVDVPSGVDRVEYYMDGIRTATDSDGSDGWSWSLGTGAYPDGQHTFSVRAYDTVGNRTEVSYTLDINNAGGADTTAPFVRIIVPQNNATVSGAVSIQIDASDNADIANIYYDILNSSCSTGGGSPNYGHDSMAFPGVQNQASHTFNWDSTAAPNETVCIRAVADDGARLAAATARINVSNPDLVDPAVSIIAPPASPPSVADATPIIISATDNVGIARVDVYIDSQYRGGAGPTGNPDEYSFDWNTKIYPNGDHLLQAYAYDDWGNNTASSVVTVNVDNLENDITPPTVTFVPPTPATGTSVDGLLTIRVDAVDNNAVSRVNFYVDYLQRGIDWVGEPSPPEYWEWQLDTNLLSDGWHRIQVDALDALGNRSPSIEIRVNVRGPGGPSISNGVVDPETGLPGTAFCILADVVSATGIARVEAVIQYPDEVEIDRVPLTATGAVSYQGSWTSPSSGPERSYYVDIEAESNDGYVSQFENIVGSTGACGGGGAPGAVPVITSALSRTGTVGTAFSYTITATNSPTSYNATGMPAWMTRTNNVLSGTPTGTGTFSIVISATNASGTTSQTLTVTISNPSTCPVCFYNGPGNCSSYTNSTTCTANQCVWQSTPLPARCRPYDCSTHDGAAAACEARINCTCSGV